MRATEVSHADRWLERNHDQLTGIGTAIAVQVDTALDYQFGVVVEVDIDHRGRLVQGRRARPKEVPAELLTNKRKRPALVADEG